MDILLHPLQLLHIDVMCVGSRPGWVYILCTMHVKEIALSSLLDLDARLVLGGKKNIH